MVHYISFGVNVMVNNKINDSYYCLSDDGNVYGVYGTLYWHISIDSSFCFFQCNMDNFSDSRKLTQLWTCFHLVNNTASSHLRKMLALIKYQYPIYIGFDVSYEYLWGIICGGGCHGHH